MIHKPRKKSLMLLKHESLEARLPSSHPKIPQITSNLKKLSPGYNGEKSVDYYLSLILKTIIFFTIYASRFKIITSKSIQSSLQAILFFC